MYTWSVRGRLLRFVAFGVQGFGTLVKRQAAQHVPSRYHNMLLNYDMDECFRRLCLPRVLLNTR
jgi:hypothetical protein